MTRSDDSQSTRPISVAELLARNGTIGAPPAGGRRRRRRGDTGSISVAELTGEIPIVTDRDLAREPVVEKPVVEKPAEEQPAAEAEAQPETEPTDLSSPAAGNGVVEQEEAEVETTEAEAEAGAETEAEDATDVEEAEAEDADVEEAEATDAETEEAEAEDAEDESDDEPAEDAEDDDSDDSDDYAGAVSDYAAHIKQREADVDLPFFVPPRRPGSRRFSVVPDAEEMSPDPDPVEDELALDWSDTKTEADDDTVDTEAAAEDDTEASKSSVSYLRSGSDDLFGGPTGDDEGAVRAGADTEVIAVDRKAETGGAMSSFMHGVWIVGQCVFAVAFGAGLFVAFDQLWKWNNIVALVLSVLVILGLVVGVRVVRKTEDIGSTLIAVAVGALVTLGPLALLQSG